MEIAVCRVEQFVIRFIWFVALSITGHLFDRMQQGDASLDRVCTNTVAGGRVLHYPHAFFQEESEQGIAQANIHSSVELNREPLPTLSEPAKDLVRWILNKKSKYGFTGTSTCVDLAFKLLLKISLISEHKSNLTLHLEPILKCSVVHSCMRSADGEDISAAGRLAICGELQPSSFLLLAEIGWGSPPPWCRCGRHPPSVNPDGFCLLAFF